MAIPKRDLSALTSALVDAVGVPRWETASDLSRISVTAMSTSSDAGREMVSLGVLRLTGEGVRGSQASLDAVGDLMTRWQKLITAIGGSKRGFTGLRGRMNSGVVADTRLLLNAGPAQGSLMLEFQPDRLPTDELTPSGQAVLFDEPDVQLADECVVEALELFRDVSALGPDADPSAFIDDVTDLGARVASALAEFAKSLVTSGLDLDASWEQPHHPTSRSFLGTGDARRIVELVSSRELDTDIDTLTGHIQTISDRARLHLLMDDGELLSIRPGVLDHDALRNINHGDRVVVEVDVKVAHRPGEGSVATYTARKIAQSGGTGDVRNT